MSKLIRIDDRKPLEIFVGRKTEGPIRMRLDESVIKRLLIAKDGPKNIYAINPDDKTAIVKITIDNYLTPEKELFAPKKKEVEVIEEVKDNTREDALIKSMEALQQISNDTTPVKEETKSVEIVEEPIKEVITEDVVAPVIDAVKKEEEVTEEEKKEEIVAEINPQSQKQQYHNKNKKNNRK